MITTLDLRFRNLPRAASAFLLKTSDGHVLIESGPAACFDTLEQELRRHDSAPNLIKHLFLTHIHLDHAGACGALARTGTVIHVHPRGAPHLIDPSKLNTSARRVFGSALDRDLGPMTPATAQLVHAVGDGEEVLVGDTRFTAMETTGHARHHHSWLVTDRDGRHVFTGDAVGMRLADSRFPTLPMVPPEFDLEQWLASIRRIQKLGADSLWMTHYDEIDDHHAYLDGVHQRVLDETRLIASILPKSQEEAIETYSDWHIDLAESAGVPADRVRTYCDTGHYRANLTGVGRWIEKGGRIP